MIFCTLALRYSELHWKIFFLFGLQWASVFEINIYMIFNYNEKINSCQNKYWIIVSQWWRLPTLSFFDWRTVLLVSLSDDSDSVSLYPGIATPSDFVTSQVSAAKLPVIFAFSSALTTNKK